MKQSSRVKVSNVLVIGCGGAGLRAAIAAHELGADVVIAARRARRDAHTVLAAGGINAALGTVDQEDNWQHHFADTLLEGYGLGDPQHIELMTREAPQAIQELAEWGCEFARTEDNRLDQRFFGAHRFRRTCHAGDWTGRAIIRTLGRRVLESGHRVRQLQSLKHLFDIRKYIDKKRASGGHRAKHGVERDQEVWADLGRNLKPICWQLNGK